MIHYRLGLILLFPLYILLGMFDGARDGWHAFVDDWDDFGDT